MPFSLQVDDHIAAEGLAVGGGVVGPELHADLAIQVGVHSCIIRHMKPPHRAAYGWIFGYCLLLIIAGLAAAIALGRVEEKTSYGLHELLLILGLIASQFCQGMFGGKPDDKDPPKEG
jgi:hypothetical protein